MTRSSLALIVVPFVCGCADSVVEQPLLPLEAPTLTGSLQKDSRGLQALVQITNPTTTAGFVTLRDPCKVVFELHDADSPNGRRVWDQWLYLKGCKSFDSQLTIGPQASETVASSTTPVQAILGDSLPPGRYWVVARVVIRQLPSQEAQVDLGPVDLP